MKRRLAREVALKSLYAVDIGKTSPGEALTDILERDHSGQAQAEFASELVMGTLDHREEIDSLISRYAVGWTLERMPSVDRNIMRMAVYEILFRADIPDGVAVNEAVELAKKFGDEDSSRFVNGVLGRIVRESAST